MQVDRDIEAAESRDVALRHGPFSRGSSALSHNDEPRLADTRTHPKETPTMPGRHRRAKDSLDRNENNVLPNYDVCDTNPNN